MADTQLQQLVINELTKAQYEAITPDPNQLYMVTDEGYLEPSDIATSITAASTNAQVAGAKAVYDAIQAGGTSDPNAVHYTAETKTTEEKAQARSNIGAGTYSKPASGIPASDIATGVIPDVSGKEDSSNKVTSMTSTSTDTQYPSAKAVYDALQNVGNPIVNNSVENHGLGWKVNAINFTWDKVVPTGAPTITFSGTTYYLISELAPSKDSFTYSWQDGYYEVNPKDGVSVYRSNSSGDPEIATPLVTFDEKLLLDADGAFMIATVPGTFTIEEESITIPKAGIWAKNDVYTFHSLTAPETYSTIDPNFIPAGSTDNPILTNAIETNGIGWKTEIDVSKVVQIEWDGDTSGKESVEDFYKVSDIIPDPLSLVWSGLGWIDTDEEEYSGEIPPAECAFLDTGCYSGGILGDISEEYFAVHIITNDYAGDDGYTPGVWFKKPADNAYVSFFEYAPVRKVNKISTQYLPSDGIGYVKNGTMIVWNGDSTDLPEISTHGYDYYKISDLSPSYQELLFGEEQYLEIGDVAYTIVGDPQESDQVGVNDVSEMGHTIGNDSTPMLLIFHYPGTFHFDDSTTVTIEEAGTYIRRGLVSYGTNFDLVINDIASQFDVSLHKISNQYLPITQTVGDSPSLIMSQSAVTTALNGKASSSHTHTATDVGLGNVVNTGDSATPVSGGTTKFTTGGAYTELAKKANVSQIPTFQVVGTKLIITTS